MPICTRCAFLLLFLQLTLPAVTARAADPACVPMPSQPSVTATELTQTTFGTGVQVGCNYTSPGIVGPQYILFQVKCPSSLKLDFPGYDLESPIASDPPKQLVTAMLAVASSNYEAGQVVLFAPAGNNPVRLNLHAVCRN